MKLYQSVIHQMKDTVDRVIGVVDDRGTVIACSQLTRIGESRRAAMEEIAYSFDCVTYDGYTYKPIGTHSHVEYIAFAEGTDKTAFSTVSLLSVALSNIKSLYDEKYDRTSFIKNIIQDNILPGDIYIKSKELRFDNEINRVIFLIRFRGRGEVVPYDVVQNMYPDKNRDYVISVGENDIALVKELKNVPAAKLGETVESIAQTIVNNAETEFYTSVTVGIGTVVNNVRDLARSYKDAQIALSVGSIFEPEKSTVNYENLGIGRLIYQLPATLCEMFLQEVFKRGSLEALDRETLMTIQAFFDNNLNVSETSRKLFVHRNTLVYRLEKIKKVTGLDLREFEDAITFKVALMVQKYIQSRQQNY